MKGFILGFIAAALLFTALHYQFILTKNDLIVEKKSEIGFVDTWADTRAWEPADYLRHPGIALSLRKKGLGASLEKAVGEAGKEVGKAVAKAEQEVKKTIPAAQAKGRKKAASAEAQANSAAAEQAEAASPAAQEEAAPATPAE